MPATLKDPWQMTRAEYKYWENKPKVDAIQKAIREGKRIVVSTAYRAIELREPGYIRVTAKGEVLIPRGKKWDTLTDIQIDTLSTQAGYELPSFYDKVYHHAIVEQALSEGKAVPPKVLADYPDLKPTETPLETIVTKWRATTARNSVLAQKDLETLKAKGYEIDDARDALEAYTDTQRSEFEDAEEFSEARRDAWEEFLNAIEEVEELDEVEGVEGKQPLTVVECDRQHSLSDLQAKAREAGISTSGDKKALCRKLMDAGVL